MGPRVPFVSAHSDLCVGKTNDLVGAGTREGFFGGHPLTLIDIEVSDDLVAFGFMEEDVGDREDTIAVRSCGRHNDKV